MSFVEKLRRIYEIGWVAAASAIASAVFNKWSSGVSAGDYTYFQMTIDAVLSFLIWIALIAFPFTLIHFEPLRRWLLPHSSIEGWWLQQVDIIERPWSISSLTKNLAFGWTYSGCAYAKSGSIAADWQSQDVRVDDEAGFWMFKGESHRFNSAGAPTRTGNVLSVLYAEQYQEAVANNPNALLPGRIADLDFGDVPTAAGITLYRICDSDWADAGITKKSPRLSPQQFQSLFTAIKMRLTKEKAGHDLG